MTKNFATRALLIAGLLIAGTMASFAQSAVTAQTRRVAAGAEHLQPVAVSAVALSAPSMNLSAEQRTRLTAITGEAAALQAERTRLWSEYNAVVARPDFSDEMAVAEAAPRMLRIVAINNQLSALATRTEAQVNSILTAAQRSEVANVVAQFRAGMAR